MARTYNPPWGRASSSNKWVRPRQVSTSQTVQDLIVDEARPHGRLCSGMYEIHRGGRASNAPVPDRLHVVSWNIEHGIGYRQAARHLRSHSELSNPSIIFVQEMDLEGVAHLGDQLDMEWAYASGGPHAKTSRDFGNAVLSRWPVIGAKSVALPHRARILGENRLAVQATIALDDAILTTWSVHAEVSTLPFRRQVEQYRALTKVVAGIRGPRLIGGDFNTVTRRNIRALTDAMADAGVTRATADVGPTFHRFGRSFELDHLFSCGFSTTAAGTTGVLDASDHAPIWATFHSKGV